jgi:hypothetical protein
MKTTKVTRVGTIDDFKSAFDEMSEQGKALCQKLDYLNR